MEKSSFDPQDVVTTGKYLKVRCVGAILSVPGVEDDLIIPAFTSAQVLGALKIVDHVGNDFLLVKELASFIFEKVTDYNLLEQGKDPGDRLYASWLQEFRARKGLKIGAASGLA